MCPLPVRQSAWDRPLIEKDKAEIDLAAVGLVDRARLAAISIPHSADWMMALPVAVCGLTLENEAVRVAVGLRLSLALCASHKCQCGDWVGPEGHHGFVCRKAAGRSLRHHAINDIIWRALLKADVPIVPKNRLASFDQMETTRRRNPHTLDWREVPDVGRNGGPYLCGLL